MTRRPGHVVLVDDDPMFCRLVRQGVGDHGLSIDVLDGSGDVTGEVARFAPDVVLLDLNLPESNGLDILKELKDNDVSCPVVMVTGTEDVSVAVKAIRAGAFDFVTKPVNLEELLVVIERAVETQRVQEERDHYRSRLDMRFSFVPSRNERMRGMYDLARKVAKSESTTVLIQGESGTGKEHVANLIHQLSPRSEEPFLEINCASLPETLLESELFGHEKGAFTDASARKRGLFELADGGTLFLDEVGEMALPIQAKLLRVLERTTFRRVGGTEDISASVRIVAATNRDLAKSVTKGEFRGDLYFRLKVVPIHLPPLRDRGEDVLVLGNHFLRKFSVNFGKGFVRLSEDAKDAMRRHPWPGNVREMKNCMERAVLLHEGEELTAEMLQLFAPDSSPFDRADDAAAFLRELREISQNGIPENGIDFEDLMQSVERYLITKASEKADWNQSQAARYLHLNRDKLRTRMKNYQMGKG